AHTLLVVFRILRLPHEPTIYTPRYPVKGSSEIVRRVLGGKIGIWKQVSNYQYRCDDVGNAIGKVMSFVFYEGDVDVGVLRKTHWEEAARSLDDTSCDDEEEEENEDESEDDKE
nr:NAC transcription factor 25 [Tanacetum cinerariifolium]